MNYLNIDEVLKIPDTKESDNEDLYIEELYYYLVNETYKLITEINKYKKFKYKEHIKKSNTLKSSKYDFQYNTLMFNDISTIIDILAFFRIKDVKKESEKYIRYYNNMLDNYNKYVEIYNEIDREGFDKLNNDIINKLTILFKDMLIYKNKEYKDSDDFDKLLSRVRICYYDFSYLLDDIRTVVKSGTVYVPSNDSILRLDSIEYLNLLRGNYNVINSNYKNYESLNEDIDLKEGETLEDLVNELDVKLEELYKSILDKDKVNMNDLNKKVLFDNKDLEDQFITMYPDYYEDVYKIRSIEDDYQLIYYFKKDLYNRIKEQFK